MAERPYSSRAERALTIPAPVSRPAAVRAFGLLPLAFASGVLVDFLTDLWGTDEIGIIGSYHLHGADIAAFFAVLVLVNGTPRLRQLDAIKAAVLALCLIAGFSLIRGAFGNPHNALTQFRSRGVVIAYIFMGAFYRESFFRRLKDVGPWIVAFVVLDASLFFVRVLLGPTVFLSHDTMAYQNVLGLELRPVFTTTVLFFDLALILVLDRIQRQKRGDRRGQDVAIAWLLIFLILFSRQRTAGLAGFIGVATFYLSDSKQVRKHPVAVSVAVGAISLIVALWLAGVGTYLVRLLPVEFQLSWTTSATLSMREEVWTYAIGWRFLNWNWFQKLFGPSAGESLDIFVHGREWLFSLHSQYVSTLMYYGISGALALVAIVGSGLREAARHLSKSTVNAFGISGKVALAWWAIILTSGYSYEWSNTAGIFAAMTLAAWPRIESAKRYAVNRAHKTSVRP